MSPVNCSVNIFRGLYMNDNLEVIIFFPYCKGFGFCLKKKNTFYRLPIKYNVYMVNQ